MASSKADIDRLVEELRPQLDALEAQRQTILTQHDKGWAWLGYGALAGCLLAFLFSGLQFTVASQLICMSMFGGLARLALVVKRATALLAFGVTYKRDVIGALLAKLHPGMTFQPEAGVPMSMYVESGLHQKPDAFEGSDLFRGKLGDTDVLVSEASAYLTKHGEDGQDRTQIFRGLVLVADFHKHFNCTARVMPDVA